MTDRPRETRAPVLSDEPDPRAVEDAASAQNAEPQGTGPRADVEAGPRAQEGGTGARKPRAPRPSARTKASAANAAVRTGTPRTGKSKATAVNDAVAGPRGRTKASAANAAVGGPAATAPGPPPVLPVDLPPLPPLSAEEAAAAIEEHAHAAHDLATQEPAADASSDVAEQDPAPAVETDGTAPEDIGRPGAEAAEPAAPAVTESVEEIAAEPTVEEITAEPTVEAIDVEDVGEPDTAVAAASVAPSAEESADVAPVVPAVDGDLDPLAPALRLTGVVKRFGDTRAVDAIDLTIPVGSFYGLVGPNGAGKTTTLSMITGLLAPDRGTITVCGVDAVEDPAQAKRLLGVLPDRLRTFDRLTGRQLLYYYGVLRGLRPSVVESRILDLARAFDLTDALGRPVADYSAGMTKKVMLAGAMIHSPRVLVLDEPFEAVDPASSQVILGILSSYVAHGGTVILSSHGMSLVERVCTHVAVLVSGQVLAAGTVDEVRDGRSLEERFLELSGGLSDVEGLEWLHTFSV